MTPTGAPPVTERDVTIGEQTVHYLQAGTGSTLIVLLHGFPQSSHEWRAVVPLLADRFTVLAPDLRGIGGTSAPPGALDAGAFDKATLAEDVHALVTALGPELGIERVVVAGHDIGGMVAYAYARLYPREVAGVAVMDIPLPGLAPWDEVRVSPLAWHFGLHAQKPLAETLLQGHQDQYFRGFYFDGLAVHPEVFTDTEVATYAAAYASDASLVAMCELYRSFGQDEEFNTTHTEPLDVPLLLVGGETTFAGVLPTIATSLAAVGARNVHTATVTASGHWIAEEQPARTAALITHLADLADLPAGR